VARQTRYLPIASILAALTLFVAGGARAQVNRPFVATLKLAMEPSISSPVPMNFTIMGSGVAPVTGMGGFAFPASGVSGTGNVTGLTIGQPYTPGFPIRSFFFGTPMSPARNLAGSLWPTGGPLSGFGGSLLLAGPGKVAFNLQNLCNATGPIPLYGIGGSMAAFVPFVNCISPFTGSVKLPATVQGKRWTTGMVLTCTSAAYAMCAPSAYPSQAYATGAGYDNRVDGVGNIQLVSPVRITRSFVFGSSQQVGMATLTIGFGAATPTMSEGAFLGLAAGMAAVGSAILWRRRRASG
jgi:hypothetical protein